MRGFSEADLVLDGLALDKDAQGHEVKSLDDASPVLIADLPEFRRVENLYRVLAIYRWARSGGATASNGNLSLASNRPRTPDSIVVGINENYIAEAPATGTWASECQVFVKRLVAAKASATTSPNSAGGDRRRLTLETFAKMEPDFQHTEDPLLCDKLAADAARP
jgi:hypothetical protein